MINIISHIGEIVSYRGTSHCKKWLVTVTTNNIIM